MRLVRKVSRKRYFHRAVYEYERILVPVPSEARDIARPWLGRDVKVLVEPVDGGFSLFVFAEQARAGGWMPPYRFRKLMQQLRAELDAANRPT